MTITNGKNTNSNSRNGIMIDSAYLKIKEMIYLNQLAPGQKLIYRDLSKRLGISITPIIQALNRLENSRLVTYSPNKGYFVGEITETEARQLYQARDALELYIVPDVLRNLKTRNVEDILSSLNRSSVASRRSLFLKDISFHLNIAAYAKNDVIYGLLKDVFERIYLKYKPEYLDEKREAEVRQEHRRILNALKSGKEATVCTALRTHNENGLEYVLKSLHARDEIYFYEKPPAPLA